MLQIAQRVLARGSGSDINPAYLANIENSNQYLDAVLVGDHLRAVLVARDGVATARPASLSPRELSQDRLARSLSLLHDGMGLHAYWDNMPPPETALDKAQRLITRLRIEGALEHWQTVANSEANVERTATELGVNFNFRDTFESQLRPLLALAKAKLGDIAAAQALIGASPLDCYDCVRMRALIAEEAKQPGRADYWFARAVHDAPSIPMAYSEWGQALLKRGQPDAAIAQLKLANQKGPHFADPLEMWGETLMAKNQSHLALAKFEEADKHAPNWGRLHLKWGEALIYAGKSADAKKQFARAATLGLTPSEKSELARHL